MKKAIFIFSFLAGFLIQTSAQNPLCPTFPYQGWIGQSKCVKVGVNSAQTPPCPIKICITPYFICPNEGGEETPCFEIPQGFSEICSTIEWSGSPDVNTWSDFCYSYLEPIAGADVGGCRMEWHVEITRINQATGMNQTIQLSTTVAQKFKDLMTSDQPSNENLFLGTFQTSCNGQSNQQVYIRGTNGGNFLMGF